jgi:hypothetical protein
MSNHLLILLAFCFSVNLIFAEDCEDKIDVSTVGYSSAREFRFHIDFQAQNFYKNALNWNDELYKKNCNEFVDKLFGLKKQYINLVKNCYNDEKEYKDELVTVELAKEASRVYCDVEGQIRKGLWKNYEIAKLGNFLIISDILAYFAGKGCGNSIDKCVVPGKDYCADDVAIEEYWTCLEDDMKDDIKCFGDVGEKQVEYVKALFKFSKNKSFCGPNHLVVTNDKYFGITLF